MPEPRQRALPRASAAVRVTLAAATLLAITGCVHAPQAVQQPVPQTADTVDATAQRHAVVGTRSRAFEDPQRSNWTQTGARPLRTILWYPGGEGGTVEPQDITGRGQAFAVDAPLADAAAAYPLVLVSHGSGSRAGHMAWLGGVLAARGYIVAAVEHNGTADEELHSTPTPSDHFAWERARDLGTVLDLLLEDAEFGSAIDRDRIGAAGFSLGGTTVLWLAGARLDLDHLRRNAPQIPPPIAPTIERLLQLPQTSEAARRSQRRAEASHRDPRVRAVFALAPAMGFGFTEAGLRDVAVPVQIVVGDLDPVTPAVTNARHFGERIPGARYVELLGERGHFTDRTPAERQRTELDEVAELAVRFFDETLGQAPSRR